MLWKGPERDGVTFSLLSRFLTCPERFYHYACFGLKPKKVFNHRIEYGNMWHCLQENRGGNYTKELASYIEHLKQLYPFSKEDIEHWGRVCLLQFQLHESLWAPITTPMERYCVKWTEKIFSVPYKIHDPVSDRTYHVLLRGKWDAVWAAKGKKVTDYRIQEDKTKGDINPVQMQRQLLFDMQTMLYVVALQTYLNTIGEDGKVKSILYNVVRRPLSGGKGTIRQHKASSKKRAETKDEFYDRLRDVITQDVKSYFYRWKILITDGDILAFERRCLAPLLLRLCLWYDQIVYNPTARFECPYHWQHPFGVRNIMDEGGASDLDDYLFTGSKTGLEEVDNLFPELSV